MRDFAAERGITEIGEATRQYRADDREAAAVNSLRPREFDSLIRFASRKGITDIGEAHRAWRQASPVDLL